MDRRETLVLAGAAALGAMARPVMAATGDQPLTEKSPFGPETQWLGRDVPPDASAPGTQLPAPMLRRTFRLPAQVRSARLHVAGYGYCHVEINGRPVSDGVLDPPPSQFDKAVFSRSHDVAALLRAGDNAIGAMLGRSYVSGIAGPGTPWTAEPRVAARLEAVLVDGTKVTIATDAAWKMADSPIHDWMYFGEHHDARAAIAGWSSPDLDDSAWQRARVQPAPTRAVIPAKAPAVAVTGTWTPVGSNRLPTGATVYDVGRITAGWARLIVRGQAGARVELAYGQQLNPDGTVALQMPWGTKDPRLLQHVDSYTLRGDGVETWEPRFTRHGFRYVQVTVTGGSVDELSIEARENHTPVASTGMFSCSNEMVNRLHENHRRSLLVNHWGFPTDTSHRDRQGWTADTHCYMDSGLLNFAGLKDLYDDWLVSLRGTQQADGSIAAFAPNTFGFPAFNDPSWGGMIVLIPWRLYRYTGEASTLAENYPAMARWMDLMERTIATTGNLYEGFSFGDHGPPGAEESGTMNIGNIEGPEVTRNAHLYHEARVLAEIARLLGKEADGRRYDAMADRILPAFNAAYFDPSAKAYRTPKQQGYRQTSNLLPLAFDMVPDGHRDAVFARLVADIEGRGNRLNTGALGTKLILPVLTRFGRPDLAWALVTQTEYPSWGYWISQGATTSWEVWRNRSFEQTLDHPFLGTFDEWLFEHLAGIQPALPGYAAIRIAPVFAEGLDHASARVATPRGPAASSWRREAGAIVLELELPEGTPAELVLAAPRERVTILSGEGRSSPAASGTTISLRSPRVAVLVE